MRTVRLYGIAKCLPRHDQKLTAIERLVVSYYRFCSYAERKRRDKKKCVIDLTHV